MVILQLEEQPAIIQAIFAGVIDAHVRALIEYKEDVNCLDCEKRTPLHAAAFKGDIDISSLLLQSGAMVNAKDSKWVTPLHRACSVGAFDVAALLLRYGADAASRDRLWQTPLHVASGGADDEGDAAECVLALLGDSGVSPDAADRHGRTALHVAAARGRTRVARLLLERGACNVDACDRKDFRPIHCAAQMGHAETIEVLLRHGADIDAKDRNQFTPLHVAAAAGSDPACATLLSGGASVDTRTAAGNAPLHVACLHGRRGAVAALLAAGADAEAANAAGKTPLHVAAASAGGADCLAALLERGVDVNRCGADGRTALHATAVHGRFTRSETLIEHGALIDCADKNGCTPLHIAAQYGHDVLANAFLSYGADPSRKGYEGRTPLHMCCLSGYVECARKFVQTGVNLNDADDTGKTPTHCAAYRGSYECLDLLVSHGADFKTVDNLQRLPIHYAASQGHYQCVFTLVGIGSPVNAADSDGCASLHLAAAFDSDGKCVEYLLKHKADACLEDNRGYTPLHYAIAGGNVNNVAMLLNDVEKAKGLGFEGVKKMFNQGSVDVTPLHLAAKFGSTDILRTLMRHQDDVDARTSSGATPLMLAAREGHVHGVHLLLRSGARVATSDCCAAMTPVHYGAKNGHSQCLALLLHNSEDRDVVDMVDRQHRTALMLAVSGNHIECVQTLLKCGADPNIVDTDEHSCLFRAVVNGQEGVVQLLLSSDAKAQLTDVNGKTVLHLAAACGHLACVQTVLGYMTEEEASAEDNQQCTALHWACYHGYANCVEYLLEKNIFKEMEENSFSPIHCATSVKCLDLLLGRFGAEASVQLIDVRQRTPLHIAALHGHADCARRLLERGAAAAAADEDGRTPLVAAAQFGQTHTVELLLSYNADLSSCDKLGNTALHWACLKRHSQTALLILEDARASDIVNMTNNDKKTPLHISARNGLVHVTNELLKKEASVLAVDNEGFTPALACAPNNNVAQCLALILQSLPQLMESNDSTRDMFGLISHRHVPPPPLKDLKNRYSQTTVPNSKTTEKTQRKLPRSIDGSSDCFIEEKEEYFVDSGNELVQEKLGLSLHGSRSETSIVSQQQNDYKKGWVARGRGCRVCYRQQYRCTQCNMKNVLKRHLTGRSTRAEFENFISKCLMQAPNECQALLTTAGEEICSSDTHIKDDGHNPAVPSAPADSVDRDSSRENRHVYRETLSNELADVKRKPRSDIVCAVI